VRGGQSSNTEIFVIEVRKNFDHVGPLGICCHSSSYSCGHIGSVKSDDRISWDGRLVPEIYPQKN